MIGNDDEVATKMDGFYKNLVTPPSALEICKDLNIIDIRLYSLAA